MPIPIEVRRKNGRIGGEANKKRLQEMAQRGEPHPLSGRPHPPGCKHCKALARSSKARFIRGRTRPVCRCHGMPMNKQKTSRVRSGVSWKCSVKERESDRRRGFKVYGLSEGQYAKILASQGGVCAICKRPPSTQRKRLAIDHDHASGRVRGVLCIVCNTMLGRLEPRWDAIAEYLKK